MRRRTDPSIRPGNQSPVSWPHERSRGFVNREGGQAADVDLVRPSDLLVRPEPGYLAELISGLIGRDFEGVEGIERTVQITYPLERELIPGSGFSQASTDSVQLINPASLANADGDLPAVITIGATGNDIRYMIGADPSTSFGFLFAADAAPVNLSGTDSINDLRFISATVATPGNLTIIPFYLKPLR